MSYRIEITADTLAELAGKAATLAAKLNSETSQQEVAEVAPVDPMLNRPTPDVLGTSSDTSSDTRSPALKSAESATEQAPSSTPSAASTDTPAPATLDYKTEVAPFVLKLVEVSGKPAAQRVLDQFGVIKASHISPELWPDLVAMIKAEMGQ